MKFCLYNVTTAIKIGGIETFYWEVAKELKRKGHDIELVSGKGSFIKYENFPIKMFTYTPREKIFDFGRRFKKWGERVSFFKNAYPYLKAQQYDVFLIRKPLDFFTAYFMKKNNNKIKIVFISGGEDFYGFDQYFSKYIDIMISVSKENSKIVSKRYNREVKVNPNGVDIEQFRPLESKLFQDSRKIKLMSVGRVVGWKGYQLILEALPSLKNYIYICIGDGEYLKELKLLAKKLNIEDSVIFTGLIHHNQLPSYLNATDIFVQPSIGHEAFGITLLEAMACNKPVVASYNGGMKDIIQNNINGYFFEKNNLNDLMDKIELAYRNKDILKPRKYVVDNFTWERTTEKIIEIIKESF